MLCLLLILFSGLSLVAAQGDDLSAPASSYDSSVAIDWFTLQTNLVQTTPGFTPPVAARAFGYSGVALYESVAPGMPDYQTLAGQLNELTEPPQPSAGVAYHWPMVANSALATITRYMYANTADENKAAIDALYDQYAAEFESTLDADVFSRSVTQGRVVADAVYIWSLTDGGHEGYLRNFPEDYAPPSGVGMWVPTPRQGGDPLPALQPSWGHNRPFVLTTSADCAPPPPPEYSTEPSSDFYAETMEVYEAVMNLTPEQREIALFWADDPGTTPTPPGHSVNILTQVLRQSDYTLDFAAEAYAKVGMVVADAFISCWYTKFQYNLIRPITVIHEHIDMDFTTPVTTPPFPEYSSGHSVQSGATAQVLTDLFGEKFAFTDRTHDGRGLPARSFDSFFAFADEAAISRLYGGIHYRFAIELGVEQGKCIGDYVNNLAFHRDM
jgi:hypothetical protein